ncbi:xanthine phosphoribosyltransferase [Lactobacillus delbrueckii]|uniref:xanthine phosphoribosyltransferase n=1 Tax=Lactobacillus delbrueckii TaxID=1584 RepID=UPI0011CB36FC|nr:xanthine phosphoribosyltransferase [Lactobacillus delbrueckii]MDA3796813.1 xanthine phosphoribosyltransferase [Lactobacillus delbrueckii]TXJ88150.1 xanthine phosphoribosyltransferase [Lactobacillus delbrueckii]
MELLEERIKKDGVVLPGDVLKVNSFLNHQIDPQLMMTLGQEFARLFKDAGVTRVLTAEASGIAPGIMAAYCLGVPMVFARKKKPSTVTDAVYTAEVFSYTKQVTNTISVEAKFLDTNDRILVIDDFLANGEAAKGLISLAEQAGAEVVGVGVVVEKAFQGGHDWLVNHGYHLEALASIQEFADGQVIFN